MKLRLLKKFIIVLLCSFAFSQNYQELQKIQNEYKKALERQSLQKPKEISDAERTAKSTALPDKLIYTRKDIESLLINTEKLLLKMKAMDDSVENMPYIGYDFFTKRDTIPFWQNIPLEKNYVLGPGDEVIISLWGESSSYNIETINRDGQIYIDKIGILNLGGKSLGDAKSYILSKFSKVYSTLSGTNPNSFIDITLGDLKFVNVHFIGFVNLPGVHIVNPFSNIINGLVQAGGVDNKGSLRDIQLIRDGNVISSTDLYSYLIKGKPLSNIRLMDQDIVYVPPRKSTIPLVGRVLKPGYYEMLQNETIKSLIDFSGGLDRFSNKTIFIFSANENSYILNIDEIEKHYANDGDSVFVPLKPESNNFIRLAGRVKNPGKYPFNEKIRLKEFLQSTSSLDDKEYVKTMDLSKIIIFRRNPGGEAPLKIIADFNESIFLKKGDKITVPPTKVNQSLQSIKINGEVKIPGIYPVNNLTTLSDILSFSGGYTDFAIKGGIEIFRDSLKIAWSDPNFILKDGDSLNVIKKTGLVLVNGEVNIPGYLTFKKNDSVKKYIRRAGGFTSYADKKNVYVVYPNGNSENLSAFTKPKITEGSTLVISQRMIGGEQGASGWQIFSMVSNQASSIATTLISLYLLTSRN